MKQVTARANTIRKGDWVVEPDGSALEVNDVIHHAYTVNIYFTPFGAVPVKMLSLGLNAEVTLMVKEE